MSSQIRWPHLTASGSLTGLVPHLVSPELHSNFRWKNAPFKACAGHYLMPHLDLLSYEQQHLCHKMVLWRRWNSAWFTSDGLTSAEMWPAEGQRRTQKIQGPQETRGAPKTQHASCICRKPIQKRKYILKRPRQRLWIIFSSSYSNQIHMSSAGSAAGVLTVRSVFFNMDANLTSNGRPFIPCNFTGMGICWVLISGANIKQWGVADGVALIVPCLTDWARLAFSAPGCLGPLLSAVSLFSAV